MKYRPEIDGLRALAVLAIILFHAGLPQLSGGFVGVDVFFVISGYLITTIILHEKSVDGFSFARFYERRARRILPLLLFVTMCTMPFAWVILLPSDLEIYAIGVAGAATFTINFMAANNVGYFDPSAELQPLLHIWSLALEEQYYLFFPILMALVWPFGRRGVLTVLLLLIAGGIVTAEVWLRSDAAAAFYLLPSRGWTILLGALGALVLFRSDIQPSRNLPSAAGMVLILIALFLFDADTPFPGVLALIPTVGALLVIVFAGPGTLVYSALSWSPMRAIGLISYGAYLWHNPVFAFARYGRDTEPSSFVLAALVCLTHLVAWMSYRLVEQPFRNRNWIGRRAVVSVVLTGSLCIALIGAAGFMNEGFPGRFDKQTRAILAAADDRNPNRRACTSNGTRILPPEESCVLGDPSNVRGALLGDSHADALAVPLDRALSDRGIGMQELTYAGCPPAEDLFRIGARDHYCDAFMAQAFRYLATAQEIDTVVLASRFTYYLEGVGFDNAEGGREHAKIARYDLVANRGTRRDEDTRKADVAQAYIEGVQALLTMDKTVILIMPIPEVGWDAPRKMAFDYLKSGEIRDLTTSYARFRDRNRGALEVFAALPQHPKLHVVRSDRLFCDRPGYAGRCKASDDGIPLYADGDHVTNGGAALIVGALTGFLE